MSQPAHPDADPLQLLRRETAPLHHELDANLPIAGEHAGVQAYVAHLRMLVDWFSQVQPQLQRAGWGTEYGASARRDLDEAFGFGLLTRESYLGAAAPAPALPQGGREDAPFAWGVAYVAEGSQLGGQVLMKRIGHRLAPLTPLYLQGRGGDTGAHWGRFVAALRAALADPADARRAAEGAVWAFGLLVDARRQQPESKTSP